MSNTYLVIDIDNVIACTDEVMRDVIKKYSVNHVDFCYEDIKHFDYAKCLDRQGKRLKEDEWHLIHDKFSREENILRIQPYSDIQTHLSSLSDAGYCIQLVTSRLNSARESTVTWLNKHEIPHHGLHFVKHRCKHLIFQNCAGVIEDDLDQAREFANLEISSYLLAHPWNNVHKTEFLTRAQNWEEIVDILVSRCKIDGECLNVAD
ncbi:MAG: hypothetical protein CEE38_01480 [Planctomycetes bacterium B3_Pla]|nr:MAG: hypothetical protein CEE38_01480 [Planctomycetes bacterium B3_Pla]